ncbi:class I SAM-dependent methyltransferase [Humibacter antri]
MTATLPAFTPMEDSMFLTLCGRALESRFPRSILRDTAAEDIVRKLDYDAAKFHLSTSPILGIAHRSKKLDEVVEQFIDRHPDAVVIDLGAGLDTRMIRVGPPSTVDWYDVDFPNVIAAREQLIPRSDNTHGIGADVTSVDWLASVPSDRPGVIVADGLLAFLAQDDMIALLERLTSHFPSGEIAFNGYSRFAIWAAKHYHGTQSVAELIKSPGFDDPREPEKWNQKLTLVREILLTREPEVADFPLALREFTRLAAHSTAWSRKGTTVLQYRF